MTREEMEKGRKSRSRTYYDYSLFFLIIFLIGFGLIMIYSTSSYNAMKYYNDPTKFVRKQLLSMVIGLPAMIFVSKVDYHWYIKKYTRFKIRPIHLLYLLCIVMQVAVLALGEETSGSQRWLGFGSFKFQPSEITKICVVLYTAYKVQRVPRKLDSFGGFLKTLLWVVPLIGLVLIENFSTALIIASIFVVICFVASRKKAYFFISGILLAAVGSIFVFKVAYRAERIEIWKNIETHPKGYQVLQGLYAISSGGLFGKGLGQSMQKLGFIPEAHNDMIFSVICEELGMVGAAAVILLFLLLLWRIFTIAINAPDLFGGLIAVGVFTQIAVQVVINVAVVTNTIPATGIPLPFISYGGTSLCVLMAEMGLVLGVSNKIQHER